MRISDWSSYVCSSDLRIPIDTFLGDKDYDKLDARQYTGTLLAEHRFSDAVTLRSRLRYVDAKTTFQGIFPDVYSNPLDRKGVVEGKSVSVGVDLVGRRTI